MIETLVKLGPIILFSAAIPFQGGTNHLNEQWPEYWVKYFQDYDYMVIDCIRKKIWNAPKVRDWYAQNILLFVRKDSLENHEKLKQEAAKEEYQYSHLSLVHPNRYLEKCRKISKLQQEVESLLSLEDSRISLKKILFSLPKMVRDRITRKIK